MKGLENENDKNFDILKCLFLFIFLKFLLQSQLLKYLFSSMNGSSKNVSQQYQYLYVSNSSQHLSSQQQQGEYETIFHDYFPPNEKLNSFIKIQRDTAQSKEQALKKYSNQFAKTFPDTFCQLATFYERGQIFAIYCHSKYYECNAKLVYKLQKTAHNYYLNIIENEHVHKIKKKQFMWKIEERLNNFSGELIEYYNSKYDPNNRKEIDSQIQEKYAKFEESSQSLAEKLKNRIKQSESPFSLQPLQISKNQLSLLMNTLTKRQKYFLNQSSIKLKIFRSPQNKEFENKIKQSSIPQKMVQKYKDYLNQNLQSFHMNDGHKFSLKKKKKGYGEYKQLICSHGGKDYIICTAGMSLKQMEGSDKNQLIKFNNLHFHFDMRYSKKQCKDFIKVQEKIMKGCKEVQ